MENARARQTHKSTNHTNQLTNTVPARRCLTSVIEREWLFSSQYEATQQIGDKRCYFFRFGDI